MDFGCLSTMLKEHQNSADLSKRLLLFYSGVFQHPFYNSFRICSFSACHPNLPHVLRVQKFFRLCPFHFESLVEVEKLAARGQAQRTFLKSLLPDRLEKYPKLETRLVFPV